jgi:phosphatidylserine/phosphatidylglycerophosphate/cardiolipin synthase-like enzyme
MTPPFAPIVAAGTTMTLQTPSMSIPTSPIPAPACRFAGELIRWIGVGSGVNLQAFARSAAAVFSKSTGDTTSGTPANPIGPWTIIELSPLPGFAPNVFRALTGGMPIQYLLVPQSTVPAAIDQNVYAAGDIVFTTTADSWFGVVFQDRLLRDPAAWGAEIGTALATTSTDAGTWSTFATALAGLQAATIFLLDHVGRPLTSGQVTVDIGDGPKSISLTGRDGDSGVVLPSGGRATIAFASATNPLIAGVELQGSAFSNSYQTAPNERYVQLLDAAQWLAPPRADVTGVQRWCPNSHVEPIVDGTPYFTRLVTDLKDATNGGGAHFIGWAFTKGSVIDPTKPWDMVPWDDSTQLIPFLQKLVGQNCTLRFIANQLILLENNPLQDDAFVLQVLAACYLATVVLEGFGKMTTDPSGFGIMLAGISIADLLLESSWSTDLLLTYAEPSHDTFPELAALGPGVATWARYPASVYDNPLANGPITFPGGEQLTDVIRFGSFHQKGVVVRSTTGSYVAYAGGIDINSNRVDTPIHRAIFPYHDVQARVTGPAAQDIASTFDQRITLAGGTPAFPVPGTSGVAPIADVDPQTGQHLVQIARTYFVPKSGSGNAAFSFAPHGETTIFDSLIAAFGQARDYIYIEDQYFSPSDHYLDALIAAADQGVKALVLVLSLGTDQIFGDIRRADALAALQAAWGTRLQYGSPIRRWLNPTPAANVNLGRCLLRTGITPGGGTAQNRITIGPISRIPPKPPFWVFIENELMLCTEQSGADDPSTDSRTLYVERGPDGANQRWGANVGRHDEGSPALCVRVPNVYVHAKTTMIDDVFMTIGSANINRRGHFHDGEINVFAVPQRLKNDPTNPARILRCQLWAEHLGLSPEMGLSLLRDPISALAFFNRPWYVGTHFQPMSFMGTSDAPNVNFGTSYLGAIVGTTESVYEPVLWPTVVDPTTTADPDSTKPGPEFP